jgi:hypothetical protein
MLACVAGLTQTRRFDATLLGQELLPILATGSETARMRDSAVRVEAAQAATRLFDLPRPATAGLEKEALRQHLQALSLQAGGHLAHLETLREQVAILSHAHEAADRITLLETLQAKFLAPAKWPDSAEFGILLVTPKECADLGARYGDPPFLERQRRLRELYAPFRYGQDLHQVLNAVDPADGAVRRNVPPPDTPVCTGGIRRTCTAGLETQHLPYWTAGATAQATAHRSLDAAEFGGFHRAVADASARLSETSRRFQGILDQRRAAVAPAAGALADALVAESGAIEAWQRALDTEAADLEALRKAIQEADQSSSALVGAIATHDQRLSQAAGKVRTETQAQATFDGKLRAADARIRQVDAAIGAISLACNGASYAACADEAAKEAYDKRLYELYGELGSAVDALLMLQEQFEASLAREARLQDDILTLQGERAALIEERGAKLVFVALRSKEERARTATWRTDGVRAAALRAGNAVDQPLVARLLAIAN